jgi:hypothetical protein
LCDKKPIAKYIEKIKTSKQIKAQAKITKPIYDYKGQLLRQYFN